jgi:hypothetical protein
MRVGEDGVKVGGEQIQWDILLRAAWSVWEARVVGTLMDDDVSS